MDSALINLIDDNVLRELGESASSLSTTIDEYIDNTFRDIAEWHHWSWIVGDNQTVADIKTAMPDQFSEVVEYGTLRKVDLLEAKKSWTELYYSELNNKKTHDILSIGVADGITNVITAGYRDDAYRDIAFSHYWTWVVDNDMELADIKTNTPDDFNRLINYKILMELDPTGDWGNKYQKEFNDKKYHNMMSIGIAGNDVKNRNIKIYRDNTYRNIGGAHLWSWMNDSDDELGIIMENTPKEFHELISHGILHELDPGSGWKKKFGEELGVKIRNDILSLGLAADVTNTIIATYRDDVYKDIAAYYQWQWLEAVVLDMGTGVGKEFLTIPAPLDTITTMYQDGGARLITYIPPEEYDRMISASSSTGDYADHYTVKKNLIYFTRPLSDGSVVNITGRLSADQLADTTVTTDDGVTAVQGIKTVIPDHFNSIVEAGIMMKVDPGQLYGNWGDKFWAGLEQKKRMDTRKEAKHVKGIRGSAIRSSRIYTGS